MLLLKLIIGIGMILVSELRRRNVFRMAVLYAVTAWLIMQAAEVVIGLAHLPDWIGQVDTRAARCRFPYRPDLLLVL